MDLNPTDMNTAPQDEEQKTITGAEAEPTGETQTTETVETAEREEAEVPEAEPATETTPTEEKIVTPDEGEPDEQDEEDESEESEEGTRKPRTDLSKLSGDELYEAINAMVEGGTVPTQRDMRRLERQMMPKGGVTPAPAAEEGVETESTPEDEAAIRFINLKTRAQKLRSEQREQERSEREANLAAKRQLVERLRELLSPTNTMNPITLRNEFFNIRHSWSEVGRVPDNDRNALMDEYSGLLDRFYEEKEIGEGERIQDYADNRAQKEEIISKAKALGEEADAVKAFRKMKGLLDEWKEVGPVAPEFKDSLWKDFKDAQQVVYKRHDDHFKAIHEDEKANYEKKKELVETLEKMLVTLPDSRQGWRRYETDLKRIHTQWMSIGRVPKDLFIELRSRYDLVRDEFYMQRKAFLRELSAEITPKLERLRELVDEADALKDSEDWGPTTEKLKALQREWTENSRFGTQVGEAQRLWKRFRASCDKFFERKAELHKQRNADRKENLQAKYDVVDRLEALLDRRNDPSIADEVKALEQEWPLLLERLHLVSDGGIITSVEERLEAIYDIVLGLEVFLTIGIALLVELRLTLEELVAGCAEALPETLCLAHLSAEAGVLRPLSLQSLELLGRRSPVLAVLECVGLVHQFAETLQLGRDLCGELPEESLALHVELVPHQVVSAPELDEEVLGDAPDGHPLSVDPLQIGLVAAPALTTVGQSDKHLLKSLYQLLLLLIIGFLVLVDRLEVVVVTLIDHLLGVLEVLPEAVLKLGRHGSHLLPLVEETLHLAEGLDRIRLLAEGFCLADDLLLLSAVVGVVLDPLSLADLLLLIETVEETGVLVH